VVLGVARGAVGEGEREQRLQLLGLLVGGLRQAEADDELHRP
jgi:hypothetical protein